MRCKYVMINGFLLKDIVNGKYNHKLMTFTKIGLNRYLWRCGNETLGVNISKKDIRFIKELLWQLSFVGMENKDE